MGFLQVGEFGKTKMLFNFGDTGFMVRRIVVKIVDDGFEIFVDFVELFIDIVKSFIYLVKFRIMLS